MGSGLLYGGIGVLWLVVLGRTWLQRRTLARADRSAPASSRQRILSPRSDRRSRSRTVLTVPAGATVGSGGSPGRRSRAVRRRRRVLLALLVLTAGAAAAFAGGRVPWWAPVLGAAAALGWFVTGASAARAGRRARRVHRRRERSRELARGDSPTPTWDSVPLVEVVARWGREQSDTSGIDRRALGLIVPAAVEPAGVEPAPLVSDAWQPVPVPLPTYVTAARVPRTVARIDLACPGSWTSVIAGQPGSIDVRGHAKARPQVKVETRRDEASGRHLAPAGAADEETAEVAYELQRAVGD